MIAVFGYIVKADTLPVKTQRALCLAARTSVVRKDLSPMPAMATVANAVVKPCLRDLALYKF